MDFRNFIKEMFLHKKAGQRPAFSCKKLSRLCAYSCSTQASAREMARFHCA